MTDDPWIMSERGAPFLSKRNPILSLSSFPDWL